jgi:hypothetical protein
MVPYKDSSRLLEIILVIATGLGKFLFVDVLNLKFYYVISACMFWIIYVVLRARTLPGIFSYWGFRKKGFKESLKIMLPLSAVVVTSFVIIGIINKTIIFNWHIIPILILYPCWGTIQQFLIIGLINRNLTDLKKTKLSRGVITLFAASLFAIVHFPSWPLIGATFLLAIFYSFIYLRFNNLWMLGLFHGWLGGLFYFFLLNRDPWLEFIEAINK